MRKKPKAPCYKDGKSCPKHALGCRTDCKEWQEYETENAAFMQEKEAEYNLRQDYAEYTKHHYNKRGKK